MNRPLFHRTVTVSLSVLSIVSILALMATSCAGTNPIKSQSVIQSLTTIWYPPESSGISSAFSVYDGTYSGTFYYDYEAVTWDSDKDLPGNEIISPWKSANIGVDLTFKTKSISASTGWAMLIITRVVCDDPVFGTGENGIVPDDSNGMNSYAYFPLPPNRMLKTSEGIKLVIFFPNGSYLISNQTASNRCIFTASPDGRNLSYNFTFSGSEDYSAGAFSGYAAIGPFSPVKDYPDYFIRTKSWTLAKVSP